MICWYSRGKKYSLITPKMFYSKWCKSECKIRASAYNLCFIYIFHRSVKNSKISLSTQKSKKRSYSLPNYLKLNFFMGSFTSEILLSPELDILSYWISLFYLFIFICTFSGNGNQSYFTFQKWHARVITIRHLNIIIITCQGAILLTPLLPAVFRPELVGRESGFIRKSLLIGEMARLSS